ncbi:MAG: thioredoxin domain-containing protein, partial [Planctomycetales bacterium]|nr:thioredoxin domain-containing protein [Planctomycetales bacterium]
ADPGIPKFPQVSSLLFLAERSAHGDEAARQMLLTTLDYLAMGGIRDHLGGGFHRYSVDRFWHIPHFEKMLYDNGQLATVYAAAFAQTQNPEYRLVVDEMVAFLEREMSHAAGGFFAALDADSEHEEGKFYRWEFAEWERALGDTDARLFAGVYASSGQPNFEGQYYVPLLTSTLAEIAQERTSDWQTLRRQLKPLADKLLAERANRMRPGTDTKILAGWNGLMIRGLADAGRLLDEPDYVERGKRCAQFVLGEMRDDQGRLFRTHNGDVARLNAYVDDYAFLVDGLIALHQATQDDLWLEQADALMQVQLAQFWDDQRGGFFYTAKDHESLIVRGKQFTGGAIPSGNAVSAENLIYLAEHANHPEYLDHAEQTVQAASAVLRRAPAAAPRLALAIEALLKARGE